MVRPGGGWLAQRSIRGQRPTGWPTTRWRH